MHLLLCLCILTKSLVGIVWKYDSPEFQQLRKYIPCQAMYQCIPQRLDKPMSGASINPHENTKNPKVDSSDLHFPEMFPQKIPIASLSLLSSEHMGSV